MTPPVPPFEQWRYQYCECGNEVRTPSYHAKSNRWIYRSFCAPCEKLKHRYGFSSTEHVKEVLGAPECAICGATDSLCIDHDHSTDRVRAWLCNGCNSGIGHLKEDPELLMKAVAYCNRHRAMSTMVTLCKDMGFKVDDHHIPARSDAKPEIYNAQSCRQKQKNSSICQTLMNDAGMHIGKTR